MGEFETVLGEQFDLVCAKLHANINAVTYAICLIIMFLNGVSYQHTMLLDFPHAKWPVYIEESRPYRDNC